MKITRKMLKKIILEAMEEELGSKERDIAVLKGIGFHPDYLSHANIEQVVDYALGGGVKADYDDITNLDMDRYLRKFAKENPRSEAGKVAARINRMVQARAVQEDEISRTRDQALGMEPLDDGSYLTRSGGPDFGEY